MREAKWAKLGKQHPGERDKKGQNPTVLQEGASEIEGWHCLLPVLAVGTGLGSIRGYQGLAYCQAGSPTGDLEHPCLLQGWESTMWEDGTIWNTPSLSPCTHTYTHTHFCLYLSFFLQAISFRKQGGEIMLKEAGGLRVTVAVELMCVCVLHAVPSACNTCWTNQGPDRRQMANSK